MGEVIQLPKMRWFGQSWQAPINEDCPQRATPVGERCIWCEERVMPEDSGIQYSNGPFAHWECFIRQVVGSIAHQQRRCRCYGGSESDSEDGLTQRDAARLAVAHAGIPRPGQV